jgi:hypothetical protein
LAKPNFQYQKRQKELEKKKKKEEKLQKKLALKAGTEEPAAVVTADEVQPADEVKTPGST